MANSTKKHLINHGIPAHKLAIIHNGIESVATKAISRINLRNKWQIQDTEILLGVACRLNYFKGIKYLIDALKLLNKNHLKLRLVIIGNGPLEHTLKEQVQALKLNSTILFTGYRSDIAECLEAFDIFISPTLAEAHSIAILEAMRAGKAIIATDVGGNTESVRDQQEALIVPPKDASSLAKAINTLAENKPLRKQLGENARARFLEKFTVDIMVKKTAEWLVKCHKNATGGKGRPQ